MLLWVSKNKTIYKQITHFTGYGVSDRNLNQEL